MIARRARPRFTVRLEVPRAESLRAWGAVAADFERSLAEQVSPVVSEARVESVTRRGPDSVRVRIAVTARAADVGPAAVIAWDLFRTAAEEDIAAWDVNAATAEVRPADSPLCPRVCCVMTGSPAGSEEHPDPWPEQAPVASPLAAE